MLNFMPLLARFRTRTIITAAFSIGLLLLLWMKIASSHRKSLDLNSFKDPDGSFVSSIASDIFVVSLPRRQDRRSTMKRTALALNLQFQFVDAIDARHPDITRILARVRQRHWLQHLNPKVATRGSFNDANNINASQYWGSDTWTLDPSNPLSADVLDPLAPEDLLDPDDDFPIPCARGNPFNPKQATSYNTATATLRASNILSRAIVACWHSHVQVIRRIALASVSSPQQAFIVFEDDVDLEWDFNDRLRVMWPSLPPSWELVMLGRSSLHLRVT